MELGETAVADSTETLRVPELAPVDYHQLRLFELEFEEPVPSVCPVKVNKIKAALLSAGLQGTTVIEPEQKMLCEVDCAGPHQRRLSIIGRWFGITIETCPDPKRSEALANASLQQRGSGLY